MNLTPTTCHYCDRLAIAYCDYVVSPLSQRPIQTCDRALCAEHCRRVGHICDRSRRTKNNLSDTIDYCKEHPP